MKHGKKYNEVAQKVDHDKNYAPAEALQLVKDTSYAKFNATVEAHFRLGVDPRQADQQVRGVVVLPATPTWEQIMLWRPRRTLWAIITRLSIFVPAPRRLVIDSQPSWSPTHRRTACTRQA